MIYGIFACTILFVGFSVSGTRITRAERKARGLAEWPWQLYASFAFFIVSVVLLILYDVRV